MKLFLKVALCCLLTTQVYAEDLSKEQATALANEIETIKKIAAEPKIIEAIKAANTAPLADYKDMSQDKWKDLPVLDPKVRYFSKNPAGEVLKAKKNDKITELFLNAADGTKVAFTSKTSGWTHKGKAKHDDPMAGKTWQGTVEMDESTGLKSVQVAIPVIDGGKAIGSLVAGFSITKLK